MANNLTVNYRTVHAKLGSNRRLGKTPRFVLFGERLLQFTPNPIGEAACGSFSWRK